MKWYSRETQIKWVCIQLINGREISHIDEIAEVKGWRLSAIIYNLRHKYNWDIITRYDESRVGHYSLRKNVELGELKKPPSFYKKKKGV